MIGHVDLSSIDGPEAEAWGELLLLAEHHPRSWCLVGAQKGTDMPASPWRRINTFWRACMPMRLHSRVAARIF